MSAPKAADLVARMQRLGGAAPAPAAPDGDAVHVHVDAVQSDRPARGRPPSGGGRRRPGRPGARAVRVTVDLEPELHRSLRIFALDERTDASEVVRALIELLDDELVRGAVVDRLGSNRDNAP